MFIMLIRHEPWDLLNELNNLFQNNTNRASKRDDSKVESSRWLPAVDIKEEPNQFILYVDIPGVDPNHVDISMENNVLTIKGSREDTQKEDNHSYHRIERTKGIFYRRFTLPEPADAEQIKAKSKQGVLEIAIGKKKIAQSRKIQVDIEE